MVIFQPQNCSFLKKEKRVAIDLFLVLLYLGFTPLNLNFTADKFLSVGI